MGQGSTGWLNPTSATPSIIQVLFGPWGENIPGDGLQYCGPTATLMAIYYLYNNGFTQLAPAPYGGPDDPNATNLELILGGLMQTSSTGGTAGGMAGGVADYLSACGISPSQVTVTQSGNPDLNWFIEQLAPNVAQSSDVIVLANFSVGWFTVSGTTFTPFGGHFLTPLAGVFTPLMGEVQGFLVLNNPAPTTFLNVPRSSSDNPQTVVIEGVPASWVLPGLTLPSQAYSQVVTPDKLGPGESEVAILTSGHAWSIPATALPSTTGYTPSPWTLVDSQTINTNGGILTVLAPLTGTGGVAKAGAGTLLLTNTNALTGATGVSGGTLASTQVSDTPFGIGPMLLENGGTLQFEPPVGEAVTATIASASNAASCTIGDGGGMLELVGSGAYEVTIGGYTNGTTPNIGRTTTGTMVIAPGAGVDALGSLQQVIVAGSNENLPTISNHIVAPFILGQDNDPAQSGRFLTYESSTAGQAAGFKAARIVTSDKVGINKVKEDKVYRVLDHQAIHNGDTVQVAALEMSGGRIEGASATLLVGSQAFGDIAGVIVNGGSIDAGTLSFGDAEGLIYTSDTGGATGISSTISAANGLTTFGPGTLTLSGDSSTTLAGQVSINSGTLLAVSTGSSTGTAQVLVNSGATLSVLVPLPARSLSDSQGRSP